MMSSDLGVIVDLLLILAGIVVVAKGASLFIDTSVAAARSFGVSQHVIGITLVAFATSLPELAVSSVASRQGNGGIAIGNVIGSNVANITLALGITALFFPLVSSKRGLKDTIIMTGCTLLFWVFLFTAGSLDQIEGVVLFILYILFLFHITRRATKEGVEEGEWEEDAESRWENKSTWLLVMISLALGSLVVLGAHVMVLGAAGMASRMGISDLAIGGTIVAVGTSLPEISASLAAGLKKRHAIALGNVVGSNVMNILMVLGVAAIIAPAGFISPVSAGS
ncbi:MAG: calcium/sodium antiporter, partial [Thermoplasmata archaeon]|nr:calcium/sodium antiporter [Thermoplasmata archaeon]